MSKQLTKEVLNAISRIEQYAKGIATIEELEDKTMTYDAVLMNFVSISAACKRMDKDLKKANPNINWNGIGNYRDLIAESYFKLDKKFVWSTLKIELPRLKTDFEKLLGK